MSTAQTTASPAVAPVASSEAGGAVDGARRRWDVVAAVVALPLLGLAQPLTAGATTATVMVLALAPVWLGAVRRSRGATALTVLACAAVPGGLVLALYVGPPAGRGWDRGSALAIALLVLTAVGAVGR